MADDSPITRALFWSKVTIPEGGLDCWAWTRTLSENGYGRFRFKGKWYRAHRFAYEQFNGPVPEGLQVRHLCHNRLCCNPAHLDVGTAQDNAQDALDAGRVIRGAAHSASKLTDAQIVEIRRNADGLRTKDLAARYGVSAGTISNIRTGKIWRHVAA